MEGGSEFLSDEHGKLIVFARVVAGFWGDSSDADEHGGAVAVVAYQCAVVFLSPSPLALARRPRGKAAAGFCRPVFLFARK